MTKAAAAKEHTHETDEAPIVNAKTWIVASSCIACGAPIFAKLHGSGEDAKPVAHGVCIHFQPETNLKNS